MKFKNIALGLLAALVVAGTAGWFSLDNETRGLLATLPTNRDLLFWSQPQRDAAFRALDRLPVLAKWRVVPTGGTPLPLPPGPPLKLPIDVDAYMAGQRSAALLVVHDGKLRLERYDLGFDSMGRWTSFSVAKSITSTLVGAAIRDGHIRSMDDKVSHYIPQMKGSAYGVHRGRRLGHALQAVGHGDQDVIDAAGLQVVEHLHPELGPLGVLDPDPQDVARAVGQHAQRQVAWRLPADAGLSGELRQLVEEACACRPAAGRTAAKASRHSAVSCGSGSR